jgi:hypothetical protein
MKTKSVKNLFIGKNVGTLAGFPVEIVDIFPHDIQIKCKNVVGLRSQIKNFLEDENKMSTHYYSGGDTKCQIKHRLLDNPEGVEIGCLTSTLTELKNLVKESETILKEHNELTCRNTVSFS